MDKYIKELSILLSLTDNVSFLLGAGISTSSGIPDYRTNGNFVDDRDNKSYPPEIAFSKEAFFLNPDLLRYLKKDMIANNYKPTIAHAFLGVLEKKGKLGTVFTQNIDNLEFSFVKNKERIVQLHGSLHTIKCGNEKCLGSSTRQSYADGNIKCKMCQTGYLRPDIVLYGEDLSKLNKSKINEFISDEQSKNMLIVSGTSLKVMPAAKIGLEYPNKGMIFNINNQEINIPMDNDMTAHVDLLGDCDLIYLKLIYEAGWIRDLFEYFEDLCENSKKLITSHVHEYSKKSTYAMLLPTDNDHVLYVSSNNWFRKVMNCKIDETKLATFKPFDIFIYCVNKTSHGILGLKTSSEPINAPNEEALILFYKNELKNIPFFQNILSIMERKNTNDDDFE